MTGRQKITPPYPGTARRIIHIDMDAFYASVEVRDDPRLAGRPVIVGGTSNRGVVSAASYEARRFGVHSAMPIAKARQLCPEGVFLFPRMRRYQEVSRQIMAICHRYTPLVEPLSLDEAFLDVTASLRLFGPAEEIAQRIKAEIREETGLTASAGVASCKLVAKIASDLKKPDGFCSVAVGEEKAFLAPLPIGRLWGAGHVLVGELRLLGVETIGDVAALPREFLEGKFGRTGTHLFLMSRAKDDRAVEPEREPKSVGNEETYEIDLTEEHDLKRELLVLAEEVGRRLRREGLAGRTVTLKIRTNDFKQITRSQTFAEPTCDARRIHRASIALLAKRSTPHKPIRLLGISLSNLCPASGGPCQQNLFASTSGQGQDRRTLNRALDAIAEKFGPCGIKPASILGSGD